MNHKKLGAFIFAVTMIGLSIALIIWQKSTRDLKSENVSGIGRYLELKDKKIKPIKVETLNGKDFDLSKFEGKEVIINFWASWCAPCVEEFPSFIKLLKKQKGNIIILAVSLDKEENDIKNFIEGFQLKDTNLDIYFSWDKDRELATYFGTQLLPESYLLDSKHIIRRKIIGITDWADYVPSNR